MNGERDEKRRGMNAAPTLARWLEGRPWVCKYRDMCRMLFIYFTKYSQFALKRIRKLKLYIDKLYTISISISKYSISMSIIRGFDFQAKNYVTFNTVLRSWQLRAIAVFVTIRELLIRLQNYLIL